MERETAIISKFDFLSLERKLEFRELLMRLYTSIGSEIAAMTPEKGIKDATDLRVDVDRIIDVYTEQFRDFLGDSSFSEGDLAWILDKLSFGFPSDEIMISVSCHRSEFDGCVNRLSRVLKSAGATSAELNRMGDLSGEVETITF